MIYIAQASYDYSPPTVVGESKHGKISIIRRLYEKFKGLEKYEI